MSRNLSAPKAAWMTDEALADIVKHPINSGASEARDMAQEILRQRDYLREKNEIIKAFAHASGGMNPEELAYHFENHGRIVKGDEA